MPPRSRPQPPQTPGGRRPRVAGMRDPRRTGGSADGEPSPEPESAETSTGRTTTLAPSDADQLAGEAHVDRDSGPQASGDQGDEGAAPGAVDQQSSEVFVDRDSGPQASGDQGDEGAAPGAVDQQSPEVLVDRDSGPQASVDHDEAAAPARPRPTGRSRRRPAPAAGAASTASASTATASTATPGTATPGTATPGTATPGTATPSTVTAGTADTSTGDAAGPGRLRRAGQAVMEPAYRLGASRRGLIVTLVVVIVVCLALAGLGIWRGVVARTSGPYANSAVVDTAATAELVGQTRQAVEKVFSYDFSRLDDSMAAAREFGTGDFPAQYQQIFDQAIRGPATQQKLRQSASVLNIGAQSIEGDDASVMALVQFHAERTSTGQSTDAPGLLSLQMKRVDGQWRLAQLKPLTPGR